MVRVIFWQIWRRGTDRHQRAVRAPVVAPWNNTTSAKRIFLALACAERLQGVIYQPLNNSNPLLWHFYALYTGRGTTYLRGASIGALTWRRMLRFCALLAKHSFPVDRRKFRVLQCIPPYGVLITGHFTSKSQRNISHMFRL